MATAGLSTLGITFGYGVEASAGVKPATFTQLTRINSIGEVTIEPEVIDASALEDYLTKNVAGRGTVTDTLAIGVNLTEETKTEWETLIAAYTTAKAAGKNIWFETIVPGITEAIFVVAEPPTEIPQPSLDQNSLLVSTMNLTVNSFEGFDTKVAFSGSV